MGTLSNIRSAIQDIAGQRSSAASSTSWYVGTVVTADGETCSVEIDGVVFADVRTSAVANANPLNIRIVPVIGSQVLIADMSGDRTDMAAVAYSLIDSLSVNGGTHTSVNGEVLSSQLAKAAARIDRIIDALTNSATGSQDGGAAYKAGIVSALSNIDKEDYSEIQDDKIKH